MPFLTAALLVVAVHLALNLRAFGEVGLVADDRFAVGLPILLQQSGMGWIEQLGMIFLRETQAGAGTALYRPFVDLVYWLELPWFGTAAGGYHAVNSVLHVATALVWFGLVRRWSGSLAAALAVAIAFVGWPGHSEATHWISARTNLQATCFLSFALLAWDTAEVSRRRAPRLAFAGLTAVLGVLALGSKESAILLVPMACFVSWLRAPAGVPAVAHGLRTAVRLLPLLLAVAAWLWLRRSVLHTWGAGTNPAWHLDVGSPAAWVRAVAGWLGLLFAPVHAVHTPPFWRPVLWLLHGGLVACALWAGRDRASRRLVLGTVGLFAVGCVAVAGLHVDAATLENVRYSYEPALAFCVLLGLGIAALPVRCRGPALACLVAAHAAVLDGNRTSWLRAGAVYARLEHDVQRAAQASSTPIRVFDAPGIRDGAFVYLIERSEVLLWPPFAPAVLQGRISSADEWQASLRELAALAAAKQPLPPAFTVAWDDGALLPCALDPQWPHSPWPEVAIGYARVGRQRPFHGDELPVQVLVRAGQAVVLQARGRSGGSEWLGPEVPIAPGAEMQGLRLPLPLREPQYLAGRLDVELVVRAVVGERVYALGTVTPVPR